MHQVPLTRPRVTKFVRRRWWCCADGRPTVTTRSLDKKLPKKLWINFIMIFMNKQQINGFVAFFLFPCTASLLAVASVSLLSSSAYNNALCGRRHPWLWMCRLILLACRIENEKFEQTISSAQDLTWIRIHHLAGDEELETSYTQHIHFKKIKYRPRTETHLEEFPNFFHI